MTGAERSVTITFGVKVVDGSIHDTPISLTEKEAVRLNRAITTGMEPFAALSAATGCSASLDNETGEITVYTAYKKGQPTKIDCRRILKQDKLPQ